MREQVLFLLLSVSAAAAGQEGPVRVWAVSDGVRVNPVTGTLLEARPDIHKDYPAGDFRLRNLVWDAETRTVRLKAARNEFTPFQAIVEADAPLDGVDVRVTALKHTGGAQIAAPFVAVFKAWYVQVRRPSTGYERSSLGPAWYPDALLPMRRQEAMEKLSREGELWVCHTVSLTKYVTSRRRVWTRGSTDR